LSRLQRIENAMYSTIDNLNNERIFSY